jgi:hypothetical protein
MPGGIHIGHLLITQSDLQYCHAYLLHVTCDLWRLWLPYHRNISALWCGNCNILLQGKSFGSYSHICKLWLIVQGIMSFALLWNATVCFSKLSVLLMYTTLIPIPSMLKWAGAIGSLVLTWNVANMIAGFLICRPLAKNWEFTLPGTCGSQPAFYFAMGAVNLVTDAGIILLPMPYLIRLRLPLRKKAFAMTLLSVGIG